jgi:hypothetical protein
MNVKALEECLAFDHTRRGAYPPLNRARRRRARRILKLAERYYTGERVPSLQARGAARLILERVNSRWPS